MKMIKDNDVKYVDFKFTDPAASGSVTFDVTMIEEDTFAEGQMFDALDRRLEGDQRSDAEPDTRPGVGDDRSVLRRDHDVLICDVLSQPRALQPRSARHRQKAEGMVKSMGVGDSICSDRRLSSSCSTM